MSDRSDLAYDIELAAELLDACSSLLDPEDLAARRRLLDEARAPRLSRRGRYRRIEKAVEELPNEVERRRAARTR